jgi:hypothetical protein
MVGSVCRAIEQVRYATARLIPGRQVLGIVLIVALVIVAKEKRRTLKRSKEILQKCLPMQSCAVCPKLTMSRKQVECEDGQRQLSFKSRAPSLSCTRFHTSGSGSGSTLRGVRRGQDSHFLCEQFEHSAPSAGLGGYLVLHSWHS